jgi:ankyrin repeat protein
MKNISDYLVKKNDAQYETPFKSQMVLNAAYFGNLYMLKFWVSLGGDVNYCEERDKWCAIHYACRWENIPMLKYLIQSNADMGKTTIDKETVFHICALWDRVKAARLLIDHGFYTRPYVKTAKGYTAYELAISKEMKSVLDRWKEF